MKLTRLAALPLVSLLVLTGCAPKEQPARPLTSATATPTPTSSVETGDMPAALAKLATALYEGGELKANKRTASALADRKPVDTTITVKASTGKWNKQKMAVLTSDKDVTLAVEKGGTWTAVGGWWPSLGVKKPVLGGKRHVLVIGSDAQKSKGEKVREARADALQVVGVDGKGGGGILGIPRDLWVNMPGGGQAKINAAMMQGGPKAQQKVVTDATGLKVEGYILTGFKGFENLVDDIGGVTVDAPVPVLDVKAGKSKLDGETALDFARERKTLPGGDFDRSAHQGVLLLGFAALAKMNGPAGLVDLLSAADPLVETNLTAEQALTLGAWAYKTDPRKVGGEVPEPPFGYSSDGQFMLHLDTPTRKIFDSFADGNL
ncbi:LCP family protein [Arthrobacter sulfonylureivorans]|uniref:LCP family protein n=1 Tax=Arthrobacter sulfonylureivorans TaxID=2486855 RepID=UPI0039E45F8F